MLEAQCRGCPAPHMLRRGTMLGRGGWPILLSCAVSAVASLSKTVGEEWASLTHIQDLVEEVIGRSDKFITEEEKSAMIAVLTRPKEADGLLPTLFEGASGKNFTLKDFIAILTTQINIVAGNLTDIAKSEEGTGTMIYNEFLVLENLFNESQDPNQKNIEIVNNASREHRKCREGEKILFDQAVDLEQIRHASFRKTNESRTKYFKKMEEEASQEATLSNHVESVPHLEHTKEDMNLFSLEYIDSLKIFNNNTRDYFAAMQDFIRKQGECNGKQAEFEGSLTVAGHQLNLSCPYSTGTYQSHLKFYNQYKKEAEKKNKQRKLEYTALKQVGCLLEQNLTGVEDAVFDISKCHADNIKVPGALIFKLPPAPPPPECHIPALPCTELFTEYRDVFTMRCNPAQNVSELGAQLDKAMEEPFPAWPFLATLTKDFEPKTVACLAATPVPG